MRIALLPLALFALVLTATVWGADDNKGKKDDKELLQGSWAVIAVETNGQSVPEGEVLTALKKTVLTFAGDTVRNSQHPGSKDTFLLDTSKTPRTLDIIKEKDGKKEQILFVYELQGDVLKICFDPKSRIDRPKELTSKNNQVIMTLMRDKKPDK
jgi:uncharacterized protein (TIGR03067 family)